MWVKLEDENICINTEHIVTIETNHIDEIFYAVINMVNGRTIALSGRHALPSTALITAMKKIYGYVGE